MSGLISRHNRYLAGIGGLALTAILVVGLAYSLTESERLAIQGDAQDASQIRSRAAVLSDAAHEQESAIDDYMLSGDGTPIATFDQAVVDETTVAREIRDIGTFQEAQAAVNAIEVASAAWRANFARPAIAAFKAGGPSALAPFTQSTFDDHEAVELALAGFAQQLDVIDAGVTKREDDLTGRRTIATAAGLAVMLLAALMALWLIRRYGRALEKDAVNASVLNRFTEVASFAYDDSAVAASNLEALGLLVHPDAGVTHILNRSKDRAIPEALLGTATAEVLPLNALARCVGIVRGSLYVTDDSSAPLSVHCPIYPVSSGTLACVPLTSSESVGAVHLHWARPYALPLEQRANVARIAEHAALAIGNRRLLAALQGQASTDARTGLANSRRFDHALEDALHARGAEETVAVLMIDIDHFKDFNDRHGHPAGDEALRAFSEVLRSCMRDGDVAARYGGEEFAVLLPGVDARAAVAIAERIRTRIEATIISLAPGITDRITISIGVGMAPDQGIERVALLRLADEALYRAKEAGRNRVSYLATDDSAASTERLPGVGPARGPRRSARTG